MSRSNETLHDEGAHAGAEIWQRIAELIEELQREEPRKGEAKAAFQAARFENPQTEVPSSREGLEGTRRGA